MLRQRFEVVVRQMNASGNGQDLNERRQDDQQRVHRLPRIMDQCIVAAWQKVDKAKTTSPARKLPKQ